MLSLSGMTGATQRPLARAAVAGVLVGALGALASSSTAVEMIEQQYGLAWLFRLRGPQPSPDEVVVIAMDQRAADNISLLRNPGDFERCRGPGGRTDAAHPPAAAPSAQRALAALPARQSGRGARGRWRSRRRLRRAVSTAQPGPESPGTPTAAGRASGERHAGRRKVLLAQDYNPPKRVRATRAPRKCRSRSA